MEGEENEYKVFKCGEQIFNAMADRNLLEDAICKASERTSVRIGDFVAVELDELKPLAGREEGKTGIKASFCGNDLYEFQLIF